MTGVPAFETAALAKAPHWLRDLPRSQLLTVIVAILWPATAMAVFAEVKVDPQWYGALEVFTGGVVVHYGANKVAEVKIAQMETKLQPGGTT